MLTVDISLPEVEELQKLVQEGQEQGFLTYDEIVAGLEEVDLTKEQIEGAPSYSDDDDNWYNDNGRRVYDYYGVPPYWM